MAAYKDLVGQKITKVTSNPGEPKTGQMWYNSTDGKLKGLGIIEAWSSASPLIEANYGAAGAGSQTAMIYFGGSPYPPKTNKTAEYNGTGWSAGGNYTGTVNYLAGCGTLTAGLGAGGFTGTATLTASAEYDGSSWTSGNSMSNQRMNTGSTMVGLQTSALITGGDQYPSTPRSLSACEEYDGTNWTAGGAYPVVIQNTAQAGTQTAGWAAGGQSDPAPGVSNIVRNATNHYDGSSWSAGGNLPGAQMRAGAAGTQTAGLIFGGTPNGPTNVATTFAYDGSTWSSKPALATARQSIAAGGVSSTSTAAIGAGGYVTPGVTGATEEYNKSTNTITAAAWASGPALGTGRYSGVSGGTTTAAILAGGGYPRDKNETELYDGTSWSEVNNMNSGRGRLSGTGTPSSAVGAGGYTPGSYSSAAEQWDGTNWSNITSLPQNRQYMGSIGASGSAALFIGGNSPGTTQTNETLYWNGSSWATGGNYPNTVWNPRGFGTISAGISCGGNNGPTTSSNSYNGSSWTSGPSLNVARDNCGASGATDGDGLIYGGGSELTAEKWDGTSFTTSASFANSHNGGGSNQNGSSSTAMIFGDAPAGTAFEEFTAETTTANVTDFTTS